jgi:hypothetical protein
LTAAREVKGPCVRYRQIEAPSEGARTPEDTRADIKARGISLFLAAKKTRQRYGGRKKGTSREFRPSKNCSVIRQEKWVRKARIDRNERIWDALAGMKQANRSMSENVALWSIRRR